MTFIDKAIDANTLIFSKIFEGIIGIEGVSSYLKFLSITGSMEYFLVITIDIW
jgi:hypothetical protein